MTVTIDGKTIFFTAMESMRYDDKTSEFVLRTVSGDEIRETVSGEDEAKNFIKNIINKRIVLESTLNSDFSLF